MTAAKRFARVLVAVGVSAVLALSGLDVVAWAAVEPELLRPAHPVERSPPDDLLSFTCELAEGDFTELVVQQHDADPSFTVLDPAGRPVLLELNPVYRYAGVERVFFLAAAGGRYRIDVETARQGAEARFVLELATPRPPDEADRARVKALALFGEAQRLRKQQQAAGARRALELNAESLPHWRAAGDRLMEAETLAQMSFICFSLLGEPAAAFEYREQDLALRRAINDDYGEAAALQAIGFMRASAGELQPALELYGQALPLLRRTGGPGEEAAMLNGFSQLYQQMGRLEPALQSALASLEAFRKLGEPRHEALALQTVSSIWRSAGDLEKARDLALQARELRRRVRDSRGLANLLASLGVIWHELHEDRQAEEALLEAQRLYEEVGDPRGHSRALGGLGALRFARGDAPGALESFEQALALARSSGRRDLEARWGASLAEVLGALGRFEAADAAIQAALPLSRAITSPALEAYVLSTQAGLSEARGDLVTAEAQLEQSLGISESLRSSLLEPELRSFFLGTLRDDYARQVGVLMQRHEREPAAGHDARALQVSERARARGLLELLAEARVDLRADLEPALRARAEELRQRFAAAAARHTRLLSQKPAAQAAALEGELAALYGQLQDLEGEIRRRSPRSATLTYPEPIAAPALQRLLDADTVLLEYSLGRRRSYVWAVTRESLWSAELAPQAEIQAAAREVRERLVARQARTGESWQARRQRVARAERELGPRLQALSRLLLGPLGGRLDGEWRGRRLAIVAPDALESLPFGVLPVGPGAGAGAPARTLLADHELVSLPSASSLALLRQTARVRPRGAKVVAVLADPVFGASDPRVASGRRRGKGTDALAAPAGVAGQAAGNPAQAALRRTVRSLSGGLGELSRLPFSRQEAQAIAAVAPGDAHLAATDFAASRETVMGAALGSYRIVHFATHALVDGAHPELSGLVLSLVDEQGRPQDGFLRMPEIYGLKLDAELVVLSACQSALGREIRGEGLVGLTRGFMYAGAQRVVASLWQVDDLATAELMKRFYEGLLKRGLPPAAALRAAQLELSRSSVWRAPYFWAGFVLQGDWQ